MSRMFPLLGSSLGSTPGRRSGGAVPFSAITGDPTDNAALNAALEEKLDVAHNHDGLYQPVDAALTALAALNDTPVGAGADQVAYGNHSHAPAIAGVEDGFMSGADKAKLDGIEAAATADQTGSEIVAAIDANLGSTAWQSTAAHASSHGSGQSDAVTIAQSQVTNLTTDLAGKAAASHNHAGVYQPLDTALTALSGLNDTPVGAGAGQVAAGNHSHAPATPNVEDGFLSASDKAKLDGIEAGATADQTGEEMVAAINANLGGTTWQGGGGGAHAASHASGGGDAVTLAQSQVTNLTTDLAGKAAASHLHDDWYMVYLASNQSAITGTNSADALFNTAFRAKSGFSISSGIMTLPANATYLVEYYLHAEFTTASTKGEIPCVLQFDGTGSYVGVTGSNSTLAHSGSSSSTKYQRNSASGYGEVTVGGADKHVKVRLGPNSASSSDVVLLGGMCRMRARKIY